MIMGSLEDQLFSWTSRYVPRRSKDRLNWSTRMKIALGTARGLRHLHSMNPPRIHRDIKPSNILLDARYQPRVTDFGFSRVEPSRNETSVEAMMQGSKGYVDHE
ncbi:hypothetical protein Drorol1_Dr00019095 [Drosera rotundifolia]